MNDEVHCFNCGIDFIPEDTKDLTNFTVVYHNCADGSIAVIYLKKEKYGHKIPSWVKIEPKTCKDIINRRLKEFYNNPYNEKNLLND